MAERAKNTSPLFIWGVLVVFYFYQFIARSSFPTVLTDEYMWYFALDATGVGALASCYYFVYTFMQIPSGIIIDKFSTRYIATLATMICSLGVLVFVATSNCLVAGTGQMMIGFGSSFAFLLVLKAITNWFAEDKMAIMTSFATSVGCLGPVIGGPAVAYIVKQYDWLNVMSVFGVLGVMLAVFMIFALVDKKTEHDENIQNMTLIDSLKLILKCKQTWILALLTMALYAPLSALGDLWGVAFIKKAYNVDSTVAAFANNMLYVGVVIGSPCVAYLTILMNSYKKPLIMTSVVASIVLAIVIYCSSLSINMIFILFFTVGFACSAMSLSYPLALMIFPKTIGATVSGFINMMSMVSGVILMPFIGYVINLSWDGSIENGVKIYSVGDYRLGLTSVLVFLIGGIILSILVKDKHPKTVQ